ncbi:SIMPL domain-containing protein [bacterium]|nr:SIMPL domain-containing protein [bacterium]
MGQHNDNKIEFISSLFFSLTDDQPLRNKTYSLALENAKMTAAAIAQDHNFTLGAIQNVQEITSGSQRYDSDVYVAYDSPPSKYLSRSFIAQFPEQITLKKELRVTFEIVTK